MNFLRIFVLEAFRKECRHRAAQRYHFTTPFLSGRQMLQTTPTSAPIVAPSRFLCRTWEGTSHVSGRSFTSFLELPPVLRLQGATWHGATSSSYTDCLSYPARKLSAQASGPATDTRSGRESSAEDLKPRVRFQSPGNKWQSFCRLAGQVEPSDSADLIKEKLEPLHGNVDARMLIQLVGESSLSTSVLVKLTEWAMTQPHWSHDVRLFTKLVQHAGRYGDRQGLDVTVELGKRSGCLLDRLFFSCAVLQYNRLGLHTDSSRVIDLSKSYGVKPNAADCMQHLVAYRRLRDLKNARGAIARLKREGEEGPHDCHYNLLIDLCGLTRDRDELQKVLKEMEKVGIEKSVETYTAHIQACGLLGEPDVALKLLGEMEKKGMTPSRVTYGTLHGVMMMARRPKEAAMILAKGLGDTTLPKDSEYYRALMTSYLDPFDGDKIVAAACKMHSLGFSMKPKSWANIFFLLAEVNHFATCLTLLSEVEKNGRVQLSRQVYSMLGSMLRKNGKVEESSAIEKRANSALGERMPVLNSRVEILLREKEYKGLAKLIKESKGSASSSSYLMIMGALEAQGIEEASVKELMVALRACKHSLHDVVEALLSTTVSEKAVWATVIRELGNAWKGTKQDPWLFLDAVLSVLVSRRQHRRAARLWEEIKSRDLMVPYVKPVKLVHRVWEIDIHQCSLQSAKLIVCCELQLLPKLEKHELVAIVTGMGKHSAQSTLVLRDGLHSLLQKLKSPFQVYFRNTGRLVAKGKGVKEWMRMDGVKSALIRCGN